MGESADIKKVGKKIDLLTFSKVTAPHIPEKEIDRLAKIWIEMLIEQLQILPKN